MSVGTRPSWPSGGVGRGLMVGIREVATVFDGTLNDDRMLLVFRRGYDATKRLNVPEGSC